MNSSPNLSNELIENIILAASSQIVCTKCGEIEFVMPLDGINSVDELVSDYICSDCDNN